MTEKERGPKEQSARVSVLSHHQSALPKDRKAERVAIVQEKRVLAPRWRVLRPSVLGHCMRRRSRVPLLRRQRIACCVDLLLGCAVDRSKNDIHRSGLTARGSLSLVRSRTSLRPATGEGLKRNMSAVFRGSLSSSTQYASMVTPSVHQDQALLGEGKRFQSTYKPTPPSNIPSCAWSRRFDAPDPPASVHTPSMPPISESIKLLPMAYRLASYIYEETSAGRAPILDLKLPTLQPVKAGPNAGVPLGGIGGGCIGRGWKGDFRRWSLRPGSYEHTEVIADQFSVYVNRNGKKFTKVLSHRPGGGSDGSLQSWSWGMDKSNATYYALYPRAWTVYDFPEAGVRLICKQVSPVIPHNYTESSIPAGVFVWSVENLGEDEVEVSIMFTFQNGSGGENDSAGGHHNEAFGFQDGSPSNTAGVKLHHVERMLAAMPREDMKRRSCMCCFGCLGLCKFFHTPDDSDRELYTDPLTFCIAAPRNQDDVDVTFHSTFQTNGASAGQEIWRQFSTSGRLDNVDGRQPSSQGSTIGAALAQTFKVEPKERKQNVTFSLAWDMPLARFSEGKAYPRMYTKFFGDDGQAVEAITEHALTYWKVWDEAIDLWQEPLISSEQLPDWYKAQLFNELYFITDGGTIWTTVGGRGSKSIDHFDASPRKYEAGRPKLPKPSIYRPAIMGHRQSHYRASYSSSYVHPRASATSPESSVGRPSIDSSSIFPYLKDQNRLPHREGYLCNDDPIQYDDADWAVISKENDFGHFLYLEGHEYLMYNTYDVHFYASFALIMNWPRLELSLQRDFAAAVMTHDDEIRHLFSHGEIRPRKIEGQVPHDVGSPAEDPWNRVNAYNFQDVGHWKDLGPKFVLQIYRDYVATGDEQFLKEMYPVVKQVIEHCKQFDRDGDGLIENEGFPDQTYDIWVVNGPSAYTGGLWLAALASTVMMANIVGDTEASARYRALESQGKESYEKILWNGRYYNYDSGNSRTSRSIMSDQMAGQWYARACGLSPIVPPEHAATALATVFANNVQKFHRGTMGAVNGMTPDGKVDNSCLQSREVWTGTTYAAAAAMIQESFFSSGRPTTPEVKDLRRAGFATAEGISRWGWEQGGYWFATPEGWEETGNYRSMGYMRALSIWSMQWALDVVPRLPQPQGGRLSNVTVLSLVASEPGAPPRL